MRFLMFSRFAIVIVTAVLGIATAGAMAPAAHATPIYDSSVQVALTLAGVSPTGSGPSARGETFTDTFTSTVAEDGSAIADAAAVAEVVPESGPEAVLALDDTPAIDRSALLSAEVRGAAIAPYSSSEADAEGRGELILENMSASEGLTLSFLLDYAFDLAASAADSAEETAIAGIGIDVVDLLRGEIFSAGCTVGAPDLSGADSCASAGTLAFDVFLGPSEVSRLAVRAAAFGSAVVGGTVAVTEPGTIALIMAGLVGLALLSARHIRLG